MTAGRDRAGLTLAAGLVVGVLAWFPGNEAGFERFHAPKLAVLLASALAAAWQARGRLALGAWGLLLLGWVAASTLLSTSPRYALTTALCAPLAVACFALAAAEGDEGRARVQQGLVVAACLVALLVLAEAWLGFTGLSRSGRSPAATLGQRNLVGALMALALPLALRWSRDSAGWLAALSLLAAALVLTRCRAAWLIGAPLGLLAVAAVGAPAPRRALQLGLLLLGIALAAVLPSKLAWRSPTPLRDTAARLLDTASPSARGRLLRWEHSLSLVATRPLLGVGPGHWQYAYPAVSPPGDQTWDGQTLATLGRRLNGDLMALAVELGPGFVAFGLGALALVLRDTWSRRPSDAPLALAAVLGVIGLGLFDVVVQVPFLCAFVAAMCGSLSASPVAPTPRRAALLLVLLGLSTVWASAHAAGVFVRTRPLADVDALRRAAQLAPGDAAGHRALVEVLLLEGRCAEAAPLLAALREPYRHEQALAELAAGCQ